MGAMTKGFLYVIVEREIFLLQCEPWDFQQDLFSNAEIYGMLGKKIDRVLKPGWWMESSVPAVSGKSTSFTGKSYCECESGFGAKRC